MKVLYSFGVFVTFAVQFFVAAEIVVPAVCERVSERWRRHTDFCTRTFLTCITCEYNTHTPSHTRVSLYLQGPNVQSNVTFLFYEDFPLSSCLLSVINAVLRLNRTQTLTSGGNILSQELHEARCGASPRGSLFSSVMCSVVGLYNETSQWNSRNEACRRATPQGPSCCSELGLLQNRVPPLDPLCISD